MIRAAARTRSRPRSGITLIEILISILIMGIGVISIATLFPLGLLRLRNAQRLTRGAYLVESATADLGSRNLLAPSTFFRVSPWYFTSTSGPYHVMYQDTPTYGGDWGSPTYTLYGNFSMVPGANRNAPGTTHPVGPGLPICYDPLWRCVTGSYPDNSGGTGFEARFGSGIGFVRQEGANLPHASGLQRISNFQATLTANDSQVINGTAFPWQSASYTQVMQNNVSVLNIFVSPEDVVLQDPKGTYIDPNGLFNQLQQPSTVVPAMSDSLSGPAYVTPVFDWRYTWFFTGSQTDPSSTAVDGEIVVCENRPFAVDQIATVNGGGLQVSGETVVEAIWGFSSSPNNTMVGPQIGLPANHGYGSLSSSRSVYLRWPASQPDPDIRTGGWIADVTYERNDNIARTHYGPNLSTGGVNGLYPAQRCYWYQIAKRTDANVDTSVAGYRGITVWTTSPLQAYTLQQFNPNGAATPLHIEAALIMPSVINVYPRTVYTR